MKYTYSAATVIFLIQVALAVMLYSMYQDYNAVRTAVIVFGLLVLVLYTHSKEVYSIAFAGVGAAFVAFELASYPLGLSSGVALIIGLICIFAAAVSDTRKQPFLMRLIRNAPLGISILGDIASHFVFREPLTRAERQERAERQAARTT